MTDISKRYATIKYSLAIVEVIYLLILLFIFTGSGLSQILAVKLSGVIKVNAFIIPAYLLSAYIIYAFSNFPLNLYHSFILEHKFALSKQKIGDWLKDQIKAGLITYLISLILLGAFYYLLARYPYIWWLIVSVFWIFFSIILAKLLPVIIIPLFFKYKRLADELLRERIIRLADKMRVKILDVFEIDFSKKTLKANAAFVGVGKTRRVILADTLKDKYTPDEIEVILAHEFAHYKLKHLLKLILMNSLATVITFYFIFKTSGYFLHLFGLANLTDVASLPLIFIYFLLLGIIMRPFENYISRRLEKNADKVALSVTGLKEPFISMMDKLAAQNLADRNPHPLIKIFFFDHPPINERIAMAKAQ